MKSSKVMEQRIEKSIDEKTNLLRNVDRNDALKINPLENNKSPLILINNLQIKYSEHVIFKPISFEVNSGDRVAIIGKNGIGKSSILKLIFVEHDETFIETKKIKTSLKTRFPIDFQNGVPGGIRTPDLQVRSLPFYPAKLQVPI